MKISFKPLNKSYIVIFQTVSKMDFLPFDPYPTSVPMWHLLLCHLVMCRHHAHHYLQDDPDDLAEDLHALSKGRTTCSGKSSAF